MRHSLGRRADSGIGDPGDRRRMVQPRPGRRGGEAGVLGERGVGVDVDHVGAAVRGEAQVDAGVAGEAERVPTGDRDPLQVAGQIGRDVEAADGALVQRMLRLPFSGVVEDARHPGRPVLEAQFGNRQRFHACRGGEQGDVELASVDERLGVAARCDAGGALHHRMRAEAGGGVRGGVLDDERACIPVVRPRRHQNAGPTQRQPSRALVGGERDGGEAGAGVAQPQPFQQRRRGHREHVGAVEAFDEVEHQIGVGRAQRGLGGGEIGGHRAQRDVPAVRLQPSRDGGGGVQHFGLVRRRAQRHGLVQDGAAPYQRSPARAHADPMMRSSSQP